MMLILHNPKVIGLHRLRESRYLFTTDLFGTLINSCTPKMDSRNELFVAVTRAYVS